MYLIVICVLSCALCVYIESISQINNSCFRVVVSFSVRATLISFSCRLSSSSHRPSSSPSWIVVVIVVVLSVHVAMPRHVWRHLIYSSFCGTTDSITAEILSFISQSISMFVFESWYVVTSRVTPIIPTLLRVRKRKWWGNRSLPFGRHAHLPRPQKKPKKRRRLRVVGISASVLCCTSSILSGYEHIKWLVI